MEYRKTDHNEAGKHYKQWTTKKNINVNVSEHYYNFVALKLYCVVAWLHYLFIFKKLYLWAYEKDVYLFPGVDLMKSLKII